MWKHTCTDVNKYQSINLSINKAVILTDFLKRAKGCLSLIQIHLNDFSILNTYSQVVSHWQNKNIRHVIIMTHHVIILTVYILVLFQVSLHCCSSSHFIVCTAMQYVFFVWTLFIILLILFLLVLTFPTLLQANYIHFILSLGLSLNLLYVRVI